MLSEESIRPLQEAIKKLHGCDSFFVGAVALTEKHEGRVVWDGVVNIFDILGHPEAKACYAWASPTDNGGLKYYAILHIPPVDSPLAAVRASIARDYREKHS